MSAALLEIANRCCSVDDLPRRQSLSQGKVYYDARQSVTLSPPFRNCCSRHQPPIRSVVHMGPKAGHQKPAVGHLWTTVVVQFRFRCKAPFRGGVNTPPPASNTCCRPATSKGNRGLWGALRRTRLFPFLELLRVATELLLVKLRLSPAIYLPRQKHSAHHGENLAKQRDSSAPVPFPSNQLPVEVSQYKGGV